MELKTLFINSLLIVFFLLSYCSDPNSNEEKDSARPTAVFSTTPEFGDTTTLFEFNASGSNDKQDPDSTLQVRWDWENDEIWDTDYLTTKIVYYQFVEPGLKTITLEVKDSDGLTDTISHQLNIITPNSSPNASFVVAPSSGDTSTVFEFNASGSNDSDDSSVDLEVRWDWENDGIWDTEFNTLKIDSHQFLYSGIYKVMLQVRDTGGLTDTTSSTVSVLERTTETSTVTDIDGNVYRTVKIGNQWWMAENLKVLHFRNSDPIETTTPFSLDVSSETSAIYQWPPNANEDNVTEYGRFYTGFAILDPRNICPEGWHIPNNDEWTELFNHVGGEDVACRNLREAGNFHWSTYNEDATDSVGFSMLPAGYRNASGIFESFEIYALFWTSSEFETTRLWYISVSLADPVYRNHIFKNEGFSVRCIKD